MKRQTKSSRRCDICNIDAHRASFVKHLRLIQHFENEKNLLANCSNEANESNITKQKRSTVNFREKGLNIEMFNKMIMLYYYNHKVLKALFMVNLDDHHINHIKSKLFFRPKYLENEKNTGYYFVESVG